MESFCGDIIYIKYQHAGGDSPEVKSSVKSLAMEHPFPRSDRGSAGEEFPLELKEYPSKVRRTRSSPSRGRRARSARSLHKRRQQMVAHAEEESQFPDITIRTAFVRKLYLMLTLQLGFTLSIICVFVYWPYLRIWVRRRPWFCYALLPAMLIMAIALACCDHARRKFPLNIILLLIFTVLEGTLLGSITSFFEDEPVMWAIGSTAFVILGLSIFALQTKWELTITSGVLLTLFFVLIAFGILCAVIQSMWIRITYASVGSLIFSIYLVVDTQLMLGKKHHYTLNSEDYIFAVLNVYIDIINFCLSLLRFVGFLK